VTDVSTSGQQTIFEGSVAQPFGMRSDLQRHRSGGLSRRGFTRQCCGIFFVPRFERFEVVFQVVEEAHCSLGYRHLLANVSKPSANAREGGALRSASSPTIDV